MEAAASPASSGRAGEVEGGAGGRLRRPVSDEDAPLRPEKSKAAKKKSRKKEKRERSLAGEKKRKHKSRKQSSSRKKKQRFLKDSAREDSEEERRRRGSSDLSSEEDESESDEDAAIAAEMKGFIVSEESGEEGESDDSEKENEDEGPPQLDEEDLALIEENTGLTVRKQPLRPPREDGEGESDEEGDEGEAASADDADSTAFAALPFEEQRKYRRLKKVEAGASKLDDPSGSEEGGDPSRSPKEELESLFDKGAARDGATFSDLEASASALDSDALASAGFAAQQGAGAPHAKALKRPGTKRLPRVPSSPAAREERGDASEDEEAWLEEDALRESAAQQRMGETWGLVYDCFGDVDAVIRILCNQRPPKHSGSGGEEDDFQGAGDAEIDKRRRRDQGRGGREDDEGDELRPRAGKLGAKRAPRAGRRGEGWEAIGEPDEVKREYLTAFDEHVRRVDDPERLFLRFQDRPKSTSQAALVLESGWITARLFREFGAQLTEEELRKRYFDSFFEGCRLRRSPYHDVRQKVIVLLDWVLNERLEIVFILHHKLHLIAPPLTEEMVWRVYELDQQYCRLLAKKRRVFGLIEEVVEGVAHLQGSRQSEETRQRLLQMWALCTEKAAASSSEKTRENGRDRWTERGRRRDRETDVPAVDGEEIALEDFRTFLHSHYRQFVATAREELQKKVAQSGETRERKREADEGEQEQDDEAEEKERAAPSETEERGAEGEEDDGLGLETAERGAQEETEKEEEDDWLKPDGTPNTSLRSENHGPAAPASPASPGTRDGAGAQSTSLPLPSLSPLPSSLSPLPSSLSSLPSSLSPLPASLSSPSALLPPSGSPLAASGAERISGLGLLLDPALPVPPPPEALLGLPVGATLASRPVPSSESGAVHAMQAASAEERGNQDDGDEGEAVCERNSARWEEDASLKKAEEDVLAETDAKPSAPVTFQTDAVLQGMPPSPFALSQGAHSDASSVHVEENESRSDAGDEEEATTPVEAGFAGDVLEGEDRTLVVSCRRGSSFALSSLSLVATGREPGRMRRPSSSRPPSSAAHAACVFQQEVSLRASPPASPLDGMRDQAELASPDSQFPPSDSSAAPPVGGDKNPPEEQSGDPSTQDASSLASSTWRHRWDAPSAPREDSSSSLSSSSAVAPEQGAGRAASAGTVQDARAEVGGDAPEDGRLSSSWKSRWGVQGGRGFGGREGERVPGERREGDQGDSEGQARGEAVLFPDDGERAVERAEEARGDLFSASKDLSDRSREDVGSVGRRWGGARESGREEGRENGRHEEPGDDARRHASADEGRRSGKEGDLWSSQDPRGRDEKGEDANRRGHDEDVDTWRRRDRRDEQGRREERDGERGRRDDRDGERGRRDRDSQEPYAASSDGYYPSAGGERDRGSRGATDRDRRKWGEERGRESEGRIGRRPLTSWEDAHAKRGRAPERETEDETERRQREEDEQAEAAEAAEWERLEREAEEDERKLVLAEREKKIQDLLQAAGDQPGPRFGLGMRDIPGLEAIELADRYNIFSLWESYLLPPDALVSNLEALAFASAPFSPSLFASRFSCLLRPTETPHIPIASSTAISSVLTYSASAFLSQFVPNLFLNASPDLPHNGVGKLPGLPGETVENLEAASDAWCLPYCVHPFDTGKQLKRVLIAYYAKILASYPPLRSLIRKRFHQICSMSTLTTVKGEAETDPAKPCWMARRLARLPLLKFVNEILPSFEEAPPIAPWKDRARRKAEEEKRRAEQREHLKTLPSLEAKRQYLEKIQSESKQEETPAGTMTRARQLETLLKKRGDARCLELFLHVYRLEKAGELGLFIHPQTSAELAGSLGHQKEFEERHRDFRRTYRSLVIDKGREAPALEALAMNKTAAEAFGQGVGASLVFDMVKQKRFLDEEYVAFVRSRAQDAFLVQRLVDDLLAAYSPQLWQASTSAGNIGQHHFAAFFSKARSTGGQRPGAPGAQEEDEGEPFLAFLQRGGGNVSASAASSAMPGWLYVQRRILQRVVEEELLPIFKREIREDLLQRAQQVVICRCREMLEWRVNTQPLQPSPEQIRRRQRQGDDEEGNRKSRKKHRRSGDQATEKNSSSDEESDSFDDASDSSSGGSTSSEAESSSEDDEEYASGTFQTERKRLRAARRQRKLQRQQRLLERRRRLVQEPALVDVLAFVVENVHQDAFAELTNFATVGSAADTPMARGSAGVGRRGRSRARVHAMLVNAWGEMEEYDVFEFLLNAPLPSQQEIEAAQSGDSELNHDLAAEAGATPRPAGVTAEQRSAYDDFERLLRFFRDHFVDAAVVGVRDRFALLLYLILKERLVPKLKKKEQPLFLELASLEVPTIWAGSDKVPQALRQKVEKEGLMCLSLARTLQDPLAEIAGLWSEGRQNYLLQLKLHPLQKLVPPDRLQSALERVLLATVGKVGVELKRALRGSTAALGGNPTASLLQFVPGLGPRKAARLLGMFKTSTLLMRSQLCTPNDGSTSDSDGGRGDIDDFYPSQSQSEKRHAQPVGLGRKVYMNCVSFLRLKNKTSDPESVDALDDTRIHPLEGRSFVAKICRDAVAEKEDAHPNGEDDEEHGGESGARRRDDDVDDEDAIVEVFRKPALLDDMDLEAFSQMLAETKDQARCLPYLEFITTELRHPYRDPRLPFESASEMEVFFWSIGEDAEEFRPGSSVSCQVVFVKNTSLVVRLQPSGIRVQLSDLRELRSLLALRTPQLKRDTAGQLERRPHQEDLSPLLGEVLHGRVAFLHYGIELERSGFPTYRIEVVATGDVVKAMVAQNLVSDVSLNTIHTFLSPAASELEELQLEQQKKHQRLRRNIRHPNYKPVTPLKGLQLLQHAGVPVGEALFRPGSSVEGLTLMVKTCAEPFRCLSLPVEERNPLLSAENTPEALSAMAAALQQQEQLGGVGSELILQGEKFDSLNAIIAQFCDPLRVNLEEVYRHPKYLPIPDLSIAAEKLRQEASSRPGSICWAILPPSAPSPAAATGREARTGSENPLRFQLVVVPPQPAAAVESAVARVLVDGIYVDHKKFSIWNQEHKSLQKLVSWWKEKGYWRRQELLKAYAEEKSRLQAERERRRQEREHLKMLEERREEEERRNQRDYVATYIQPRNEQSAKEWYERAVRRQKNYEPRAAGTVVETGKGGERRTPSGFPGDSAPSAGEVGPYSQAASLSSQPYPASSHPYPAYSPYSHDLGAGGRPTRRGPEGRGGASSFGRSDASHAGASQPGGWYDNSHTQSKALYGSSEARRGEGRGDQSWSSGHPRGGGESQHGRSAGHSAWESGGQRFGYGDGDRNSYGDRRAHERDESWRRDGRRGRFGDRRDR
uniref:Transcription elongation factor SPT6 n=1 Tax=Neospora caninum (strain Liverpool) TaxID=572307 RepID=A0A0F7UKQ6_NEOCL|nr:TPA: transcription elongation factor SPT6 [Neospora caninum Liverpool]